MRYSDPESTESADLTPAEEPRRRQAELTPAEERLQREVEALRRELDEQKRLLEQARGGPKTAAHASKRPSNVTVTALALLAAAAMVLAFFAGYLPRQRREAIVNAEARQQEKAAPRVSVATLLPVTGASQLVLPGNIQAVTEAPILARTTGYIQTRKVDIGDRVQAGQVLAIIEEPDIDQQVQQARAAVEQAQAALDQALASQEQGKANTEIARITAERWGVLASQGVVSRQENDQYQAQYKAQSANLAALGKAVAAARSNLAASQANLARLREIQGFREVKAPFAGVITERNVDIGALVNAGSTLLFRIAQTGTLRAYVNVPQSDAASVHLGQPALLTVSNLPGRQFPGTVTRTANALDPATRTLLVEVQVPNNTGLLLPGMYANVDLRASRTDASVIVPGDALVVRSDGPQVAVVGADQIVHFRKIQIVRDNGDYLEVSSGVRPGDQVVLHPNDSVREGVKVEAVEQPRKQES
jgi:RND family efflux transporter MFP subunit